MTPSEVQLNNAIAIFVMMAGLGAICFGFSMLKPSLSPYEVTVRWDERMWMTSRIYAHDRDAATQEGFKAVDDKGRPPTAVRVEEVVP